MWATTIGLRRHLPASSRVTAAGRPRRPDSRCDTSDFKAASAMAARISRSTHRIRQANCRSSQASSNLTVETGHFPSWPLMDTRRPCKSSSQTFSTVPAFPSLRTTALPTSSAWAFSKASRIAEAARLIGILVTAGVVISEAFRSPTVGTSESREGEFSRFALKAYQGERRGAARAKRWIASDEGIQKKIVCRFHAVLLTEYRTDQ